jgi:hypothetical protein
MKLKFPLWELCNSRKIHLKNAGNYFRAQYEYAQERSIVKFQEGVSRIDKKPGI